MEKNPISQKVDYINALWKEAVFTYPKHRVFMWQGMSNMDLKMIAAFNNYMLSEENTDTDIYFNFSLPYTKKYEREWGRRSITLLAENLDAWQHSPDAEDEPYDFKWKPVYTDTTDAADFIGNLNGLVKNLDLADDQFMVATLLPHTISNISSYCAWLAVALEQKLHPKIRIALFDMPEINMLKRLPRPIGQTIKPVPLQLGMSEAIAQVAAEARAKASDPAEKDLLTYKEELILLGNAIAHQKADAIETHKAAIFRITRHHSWPHLEVIAYMLLHGYGNLIKDKALSTNSIDQAICKADEATELRIKEGKQMQLISRIAKGNYFLIGKNYAAAADWYYEALNKTDAQTDAPMMYSLYQMLGKANRLAGNKRGAWNFYLLGWAYIAPMEEDAIRINKGLRYYAAEMLDIAIDINEKNRRSWWDKFDRYWGEGWNKNLKKAAP
jgi:hypothetical protein